MERVGEREAEPAAPELLEALLRLVRGGDLFKLQQMHELDGTWLSRVVLRAAITDACVMQQLLFASA